MEIFEIILMIVTIMAYSLNSFMSKLAWKTAPLSGYDTDEVIINYTEHFGNPLTHWVRTFLLGVGFVFLLQCHVSLWVTIILIIALVIFSSILASLYLLVVEVDTTKLKTHVSRWFWIAFVPLVILFIASL